MITAEASEAAGDQGAFWEMHDLLYERQQEWASKPLEEMPDVLSGYAEELGLDTEAFDEVLADGTYNDKVMAAYNSATAAGLGGHSLSRSTTSISANRWLPTAAAHTNQDSLPSTASSRIR